MKKTQPVYIAHTFFHEDTEISGGVAITRKHYAFLAINGTDQIPLTAVNGSKEY